MAYKAGEILRGIAEEIAKEYEHFPTRSKEEQEEAIRFIEEGLIGAPHELPSLVKYNETINKYLRGC